MKFCVHGLGFMAECGEDATTTREGWPLCDEHAGLWDRYDAWILANPSETDFIVFAGED